MKKVLHKIMCMALAAVMMITVLSVAAPSEVEAAGLSFKSSGKSAVTIKDEDCYKGTGYKTHYIKYKPKNTGYVTLKFQNASNIYSYSFGYVTLCNKSKKSISQKEELWHNGYNKSLFYTRTYAVKKNQTYYFAVKCDGGTKITANFTKVAKSTANTKAKAKNIAKGKTTKGVILAGENKADWYKIKMTSSKKLKITCTAKTNGDTNKHGIKVTFYDKNGKKWTSDSYVTMTTANPKNGMNIYMSSNYGSQHTIPTGTYWVKVERLSKQSSGYYTLKWSTY